MERESGGLTVHALLGPEQRESVALHADAVLLATGGYETVLPFPGWTLPGVVTAGGAQAMLKGGLVTPGRTVVVAGTGPLLLPVATGLAAAGVRVAALVESTDPARLPRHARALAGKLPEAAGYAARLLRHRVPVLTRHTVVRAHGEDRLTGVTVAALDAGAASGPAPSGCCRATPSRWDTACCRTPISPRPSAAGSTGTPSPSTPNSAPTYRVCGRRGGHGHRRRGPRAGRGHIAGRSIAARLRGTAPTRTPGRPPPGCAPVGVRPLRPSTPCTLRPPTGARASPTTR